MKSRNIFAKCRSEYPNAAAIVPVFSRSEKFVCRYLRTVKRSSPDFSANGRITVFFDKIATKAVSMPLMYASTCNIK